uniref:hypothetical protein n=1 Tax=Salmonella sp. ZJHZ20_0198 TaxID=3159597 RepID=UPI0039786147
TPATRYLLCVAQRLGGKIGFKTITAKARSYKITPLGVSEALNFCLLIYPHSLLFVQYGFK